jgi:hypothetical protein
MREGAKIWQKVASDSPPLLPMPSQGDWLPDLVEFSLTDDDMMEAER